MANVFTYKQSYDFFRDILEAKKAKNPSFSLRAAARSCGLSPAALSMFLNGKKKISVQVARQLAVWTKLRVKEQEYFITMVEHELARSASIKQVLENRMEELAREEANRRIKKSKLDYDFVFSNWFHLPLLVMLKTPELCQKSPQELANFLNLDVKDISNALKQFQKIGIAEYQMDGWKINDELLFAAEGPHLGLRNFHRLMLGKAQDSLETQNNSEKFVGSETMLFDEESLQEANEAIEECFSKVLAIAAKSKKQKLYHFGIQLFKLSK